MSLNSSDSLVSVLKSVSTNVNLYFGAVFAPCGIVLNLLTCLVYSCDRRLKKRTNMGLFYIALGLYDSLVLINSIVFTQLLPSLSIRLTAWSDDWCRFSTVWARTVIYTPSWVQVIKVVLC